MLISEEQLSQAFGHWRNERVAAETAEPETHLGEIHLSETDLLRLAGNGELTAASASELRHLDNCSACFERWAAWRRAVSAAAEADEAEFPEDERLPECACGFQEAAASPADSSTSEPRVYTSGCGGWRLELLPERENPERGLLVLTQLNRSEKSPDTSAGYNVTVFDRQGRRLLSGTLEEGRLARLCTNFSGLDLTLWTVISQSG